MKASSTQIRITLPQQMRNYLQAKADTFGLSLSAYVRNIIFNDVQDVAPPVHEMSQHSLDALQAALKQAEAGELKSANSIDELLAD
jgi:predicted DNA-binding protein